MTTIVFIVFISFGCVFFLALATIAFCYFIKKWKCNKTTEKNETVHVDEHLKASENILQGPNGMKTVAITIDDDLHVHEEDEAIKNEKIGKDVFSFNDCFCCFIKKWKCSKATEKNEMVHVDEHLKVSENILQGPNGMKTVAITIDDDLHVHEEDEAITNEKLGKGGGTTSQASS
ncbi:hypothetical protein L1987_07935 [Smallanthus sonchifolius]|uniref:Uncharacterized protein n=1 Tax=Smallanthus sonchifolius TaxID=185202 RepID=A0ACB9JIU1_9ASTR|nr:hypothetical protein L1987_07935 [Smallanthus sonchifolius]